MESTNYVLPPESIVDIAFQTNGKKFNLHVNTISGVVYMEELKEREKAEDTRPRIFTHILPV